MDISYTFLFFSLKIYRKHKKPMSRINEYSKWDGIGDSEDEQEKEDNAHRSNLYQSLHMESQQLFDYASAGALAEVKKVLDRGAFINCKLPQNGNTALHMSLWLEHRDVSSYLLTRGADPEIKDNDGLRPLHTAAWAAFSGDVKMVEVLLAKGVEIDPQNNSGNTPLHLAATVSYECTEVLLNAGANPLIRNENNQNALEYSKEKGFGATMKRKRWQELLEMLAQAIERWEAKKK